MIATCDFLKKKMSPDVQNYLSNNTENLYEMGTVGTL